MNQVIEAIEKRRSVRLFESKPVPRKIIDAVVKAGNAAPFVSEKRFQPWRFVVVQDPKFKQTLVQTTFPIWKKSMENMKEHFPEVYNMGMKLLDLLDESKDPVYYSSPVIIFVIAPSRNNICCSLACENMMIAATSLGLGSCYVGFGAMVKGNPEVVKALELTEDERIFGPILLGYPKENLTPQEKIWLSGLAPKKKEPIVKWI